GWSGVSGRVVKERRSAISATTRNARPWIAYEICIGSRAGAVRDSSIVTKCAEGNAEGCAGLQRHDPGVLPASEHLVGEARFAEKRQIVDVADREIMAQVKVGIPTSQTQVVGVHSAWGISGSSIRSIVNRVAVRIRQADREWCDGATRRNLQRVVCGTGGELHEVDIAKAYKGTRRIGIATTRDIQVQQSVAGDRNTVRGR